MRVKDILGNNRNIKLEEVQMTLVGNYPCYWHKERRIAFTEEQQKMLHNVKEFYVKSSDLKYSDVDVYERKTNWGIHEDKLGSYEAARFTTPRSNFIQVIKKQYLKKIVLTELKNESYSQIFNVDFEDVGEIELSDIAL